jgi:UDP-glucose 4-epimerase
MKKVLVTGGAGFIGSNLVDALIEKGWNVVVVDNLERGKRENVHPEAEFHRVDIRDLENMAPLFPGVDYVFHLAALPRVQPSIQEPVRYHDVNVNGTLNVLVAARDAGVKKVVFSSSSSVYGEQEYFPTHEELPLAPMHPYALHKHIGELHARQFSQLYELPTVSLRYFNVYGKRQVLEGAYALVLGIFVRQRLAGEPLTIVGDGEQRRDFTSVIDVINANILAAENEKVISGDVFNIGSGRNYSINEIAQVIGGPTVSLPPRIEAKLSLADNTKARKVLGWAPTVDLLQWLKEHKKEVGIED